MAKTELFAEWLAGNMVIANQLYSTGKRFFVHAGTGSDTAGYGYSPETPTATLDYAVGLCTANKGDVIILMPGHAENIASATGCVIDIAGVRIVGLGQGTLRPTLTLTTATTALVSITAANVWIENVLIVSNFLNIASAMTAAATADGLTLKNVEFRNTSVILGALIQLTITAACADVTIDGLRFNEVAAAGLTAPATNVILCAGAADRFTLKNSRIYCFTTAAPVALSAAASTDVLIENVRLLNRETGAGLGIAAHNSTTGFVEDVTVVNLKDTVKGTTGTGLAIGARVNYSNAVNAYAGLFSYTIDS